MTKATEQPEGSMDLPGPSGQRPKLEPVNNSPSRMRDVRLDSLPLPVQERGRSMDLSKAKLPMSLIVGLIGALAAVLAFAANYVVATKGDIAMSLAATQDLRIESAEARRLIEIQVQDLRGEWKVTRRDIEAMKQTVDDIARKMDVRPSTMRVVTTATRSSP